MDQATAAGEVTRSMLVARDEKIERIVAMVDGLPARGIADDLIAPLRQRLARLRVRRPLNFPRLLFTPLDPLIAPDPGWRTGQVGLPRRALAPLARQCRALLGEAARPIEAVIDGHDIEDVAVIREAGAMLWPLVADAMAGAPPPPDWAATGLSAGDHGEMVLLLRGVLPLAVEIEALAMRAAEGAPTEAKLLRPLLARAAGSGSARGVAGVLAVLLARLPMPERVLNVAGELAATGGDKGGAAADAAIDCMLDNVRPEAIVRSGLADAADSLLGAAALLNGVERPGAGHRAPRRARSAVLRQALQQSSRARFEYDLRAQVLQPLAAGAAPCEDAAQDAIETAARGLRRFEHSARQLGGDSYERVLLEAADTLRDGAGPLADRIRVIEILLGSDHAREMLKPRP